MSKSPDAFRTISEVAEWLDRPAHVLRFWESKFTQVKPIKRAGGRRYYRPQDMLLLGGIKKLLHDDGLTIKGVQKLLREEGIAYVAELSQPLDVMAEAGELVPSPEKVAALKERAENPESATLLQFPRAETPTAEAVESELSSASYEDAVEDYVAEPDIDLPEAEPDVTEEKAFKAPSFFDVFDAEPAPTAEPPAEAAIPADAPEAAPVVEEAEPETEAPTALAPRIVSVPVDADSDAGPGILTRLLVSRSELAQADLNVLRAARASVSDLCTRLRAN